MPPEILALIDKPLSLVVVLFVGALVGMAVERVVSQQRREAWKRRNTGRWKMRGSVTAFPRPGSPARVAPIPDAADQLRTVMGASFERRRLLSKKEAEIFRWAEEATFALGKGWRVMAQVCLGEVLKSEDEAAFRAINSKRVDVLVVCNRSLPCIAIEYQGEGHHQGTASARDAVKKEALRRAGVRYIEVTPEHGPDDLKREISRAAQVQQLKPTA